MQDKEMEGGSVIFGQIQEKIERLKENPFL